MYWLQQQISSQICSIWQLIGNARFILNFIKMFKRTFSVDVESQQSVLKTIQNIYLLIQNRIIHSISYAIADRIKNSSKNINFQQVQFLKYMSVERNSRKLRAARRGKLSTFSWLVRYVPALQDRVSACSVSLIGVVYVPTLIFFHNINPFQIF